MIGIRFTLKAVFFIRYEYSLIELQLTIMVWLINNQGAIATISQAAKGVPFVVCPPLRPKVKANQITQTYIMGWINAQGKPINEDK